MKIQINGKTVLELSDTEIACLDNDLLSKTDWIVAAIVGKVNQCKKRFIQEWQPKLFNDSKVASIPATGDDFISVVIARADYKNRVSRDSAEKT